MKNRFGWRDKKEIEQTQHNINEDYKSYSKRLKNEIRKAKEAKNGN